jgi:hypothetical protein
MVAQGKRVKVAHFYKQILIESLPSLSMITSSVSCIPLRNCSKVVRKSPEHSIRGPPYPQSCLLTGHFYLCYSFILSILSERTRKAVLGVLLLRLQLLNVCDAAHDRQPSDRESRSNTSLRRNATSFPDSDPSKRLERFHKGASWRFIPVRTNLPSARAQTAIVRRRGLASRRMAKAAIG